MDEEDYIPKPKDWTRRDIEKLSIMQLQEYISELKKEIDRVESDINSKKNFATAAEAIFKK
ncbi:MAG: hypothetical protein CMM53_04565 [Rhodospirillaceae bacterium]|nr:hypothetical protein [Rhodospirillaceae bacterium]|tara:strand:+ start:1219 stop:1401 length:183 start_codon:yes stop_codon:yes gene_type:complete